MIRLRQVALVARDLEAAERELTEALGIELCFRDPGVGVFGLRNGLFPVGDQFIEIVSPGEPGTTAGRLLAKLGGDGGYMVIVQTDDLAAAEQRISTSGARVVFDARGDGIRGLHLHPNDVPGAIVSIDRADQPAEWPWAGPAWREHADTRVVAAITGVTIAVDDPDDARRRWANVLGAPVVGDSVLLDDARIDFCATVPNEPQRLIGMELAAADDARRGARRTVVGVDMTIV